MRHFTLDELGRIIEDTGATDQYPGQVLGYPIFAEDWMVFPGELYVEEWRVEWGTYGFGTVANRQLFYSRLNPARDFSGKYVFTYGDVPIYVAGAPALLISGYPFTFKEVEKLLHVGEPVPEGLPLRRCDGVLTDGYVEIPLDRPRYSEWKSYRNEQIGFLKPILEKDWPLLIKILEGKPFKVVESTGGASELVKRERQAIRQAERREKRIAAFAKGQCLDPAGIEEMEVGEGKFLYAYEIDGKPRYATDSPAYGVAAWFFEDRKVAEAWALREISFDQARLAAIARVTHHKGWEQKTAQYMPLTEGLVAVP